MLEAPRKLTTPLKTDGAIAQRRECRLSGVVRSTTYTVIDRASVVASKSANFSAKMTIGPFKLAHDAFSLIADLPYHPNWAARQPSQVAEIIGSRFERDTCARCRAQRLSVSVVQRR